MLLVKNVNLFLRMSVYVLLRSQVERVSEFEKLNVYDFIPFDFLRTKVEMYRKVLYTS